MAAEIWQYRYKYDENTSSIKGWSDWETLTEGEVFYPVESKIADIRYWINEGKRYQLRCLTQTSIEGYEV